MVWFACVYDGVGAMVLPVMASELDAPLELEPVAAGAGAVVQ